MIRVIEASYDGSFTQKFFNLIMRVANKVNDAYENSLTHKIIDKLVKLLILLITNSAIFGFFLRPGNLNKW